MKENLIAISEEAAIETLEETLKKAGVEETKLELKTGGVYWLNIKCGFKIAKNKSGIILNINGYNILVKNYHPLLPFHENSTRTKLFLMPIGVQRT